MNKKEANEIIEKVEKIKKIDNICLGSMIFGAILLLIISNQDIKVNENFVGVYMGLYMLIPIISIFTRMCPNCGTHMGMYRIPDKCTSCKVKFRK